MAAEPFIPPVLTRSDESIASFVGRRFGREALTYLAEPMLAGFHRGDARRLSVHSLFPALVDAERKEGSVARAWHRNAAAWGQQRQRSMSLGGGLRQLVEGLRAALPSGVVATGSQVSKVERGQPYVVRFVDGRTLSAAAVVLAAPAYVAAELVAALDRELADLLGSIRYVSAVTVALSYPSGAVRRPLRGWGLVVPVPERRRLTAATWLSSKWPNRAPAEHVLIRASLGGSHDPAAIDEPDGILIGWAHDDLRGIVGLSTEPTMARVYRWRRAIPQLEVGHGDCLSRIERRLARLPGLFISAGGVRGVGISECIADAQAVAQRIFAFLISR
jgi:oxygen-dependent protoporphyrinogen oxidase